MSSRLVHGAFSLLAVWFCARPGWAGSRPAARSHGNGGQLHAPAYASMHGGEMRTEPKHAMVCDRQGVEGAGEDWRAGGSHRCRGCRGHEGAGAGEGACASVRVCVCVYYGATCVGGQRASSRHVARGVEGFAGRGQLSRKRQVGVGAGAGAGVPRPKEDAQRQPQQTWLEPPCLQAKARRVCLDGYGQTVVACTVVCMSVVCTQWWRAWAEAFAGAVKWARAPGHPCPPCWARARWVGKGVGHLALPSCLIATPAPVYECEYSTRIAATRCRAMRCWAWMASTRPCQRPQPCVELAVGGPTQAWLPQQDDRHNSSNTHTHTHVYTCIPT